MAVWIIAGIVVGLLLVVIGLVQTVTGYPFLSIRLGGGYARRLVGIYHRAKIHSTGFINLRLQSLSYRSEQVVGADWRSFTVLADGYARDKRAVYFGQR